MPSPKAKNAAARAAKRNLSTTVRSQESAIQSLRRERRDFRNARVDLQSLDVQILTEDELARGHELQSIYEILNARTMSLTHDALGDAWRSAAEAYRENPTDKTFAAMKLAALNKSFFRADTRSRSQCKIAVGTFLAREMIPWALQIVNRNIAAATDAFKKVRAVENRRCIKLTGQPLNQSDIVTAAERPVRQLESIRARLDRRKVPSQLLPSPAAVLKMFAAIGSERFTDLIAPEFSPEQIAAAVEEEEKARADDEEAEIIRAAVDEGVFPPDSETTADAPTL